MRIVPLTIIALLGVSHAEVPLVKLTAKDTPMFTWPMYTPYYGCYEEPTKTFAEFQTLIRDGQLGGPCHYTMSRHYKGKVGRHAQAYKNSEYTRFVIKLQAPKQMTTRIVQIDFGQKDHSSGCSRFRFSRVTRYDKEEPRPFKVYPKDDKTPQYTFKQLNHIERGTYLIEVPSTCFTDGSLTVHTLHVYEDVAMQVQRIEGSGTLYGNSTQCDLPHDKMLIRSHKRYLQIAKYLSPNCQYSYERDYRWVLPTTHIFGEKNGKRWVLAQVHLNEPMMADATRTITKLSLENVSGATCQDAALYARNEMMIHRGTDHRIKSLVISNGMIDAFLSPGKLADTSRDFIFVLPEGCELTNAVLRMHVADRHIEPSKLAQDL